MFSELPKLFDRNFAIAYFLPVSLFLLASARLLYVLGYWPAVNAAFTDDKVFDASVVLFGGWILSILLLVLNREIYRFLEGYGTYNPLVIFKDRSLNDYHARKAELKELDKKYANLSPDENRRRNQLMAQLVKRYPDHEDHFLPTAFGNTLRAFEVYPRVMYGLEGIDGWPRLMAVIPKEFRELIEDAKAKVDWWVNLIVLSFAFLLEFWALVFLKWKLTPGWLYTAANLLIPLVLFLLLSWFLLWRATAAAEGWGDYVKAAFDLYRFDLLEALGIADPGNRLLEVSLWTSFSRAILYHKPRQLPRLKGTRKTRSNKTNPNL